MATVETPETKGDQSVEGGKRALFFGPKECKQLRLLLSTGGSMQPDLKNARALNLRVTGVPKARKNTKISTNFLQLTKLLQYEWLIEVVHVLNNRKGGKIPIPDTLHSQVIKTWFHLWRAFVFSHLSDILTYTGVCGWDFL